MSKYLTTRRVHAILASKGLLGAGSVFFVDGNHSAAADEPKGDVTDPNARGRSPDFPFATVDYAVSQCTANKGDVIVGMPAHAESTTTADAEIFDLDVAGVTFVGLGEGDKRPTFTLGIATATAVIGAAGCRVSNVIFKGDISDLVAALEVEAVTGCKVDNCLFYDTATNKDMLIGIKVAAGAHRLTLENNHFLITVGGEATEAVDFAGACDGLVMRNNILLGDWKGAGGAIGLDAAASANILVVGNLVKNADAGVGLVMDLHASTTGLIHNNIACGTKSNTETITGGEAVHIGLNYGSDAVAVSSLQTPAATAAWA